MSALAAPNEVVTRALLRQVNVRWEFCGSNLGFSCFLRSWEKAEGGAMLLGLSWPSRLVYTQRVFSDKFPRYIAVTP